MKILEKHKTKFPDIDSLYDYQEAVLNLLGTRNSTLAIIPTGGGKSLLYQLMALELEGITFVVSPLLALMEEQVNELNGKRGIPALALNSNIPFQKQREILRTLNNDSFKLIYISPERLQNPFFRAAIIASGINVPMIVVDEAHCISQWGNSFRPDYSQINDFVDFLKINNKNPFLLCLTATLSQTAKKDIISEFKIAPENVYVSPKIIRDNLILNFCKVDKEENKEAILRDFLNKFEPEKAIAYLYSRYQCEKYADALADEYRTDYYHSEVDADEKKVVYDKFLSNEINLLFATTAFGMGINIPDIDSVIHIHIPNSIEEYYQQVGRGWRRKDLNKDCHCMVLWTETNFESRTKEIEDQRYNAEYIQKAFKALIGGAKIRSIGQVVNKDREALINSEHNLQSLKYKLEKHGVLKTIGEINGSPLTIELKDQTSLWQEIVKAAENGMDSFGYVSQALGIHLTEIIEHLYEQDLNNNIKKLPASKKDVYFELLTLELSHEIAEKVINEISLEVDFRLHQLKELKELFTCDNVAEQLNKSLK